MYGEHLRISTEQTNQETKRIEANLIQENKYELNVIFRFDTDAVQLIAELTIGQVGQAAVLRVNRTANGFEHVQS